MPVVTCPHGVTAHHGLHAHTLGAPNETLLMPRYVVQNVRFAGGDNETPWLKHERHQRIFLCAAPFGWLEVPETYSSPTEGVGDAGHTDIGMPVATHTSHSVA